MDHAGEAATLDRKNGAVEFSGSARVALKAPLEVGEAWTIMGWFRTPMPGWGQQCFQNMCANHGMNGSPVVMEGGLLGNGSHKTPPPSNGAVVPAIALPSAT